MSLAMETRKSQTEFWLQTALLELVEEHGFERITVSQLCKKAGINRGTFYLHYTDKFHLFEDMKKTKWDGLTAMFSQASPRDLIEQPETGQVIEIPLRIISYFYQHADFFRVIFGPHGDPKFEQQFRMFVRDLITERMKEMADLTMKLPASPPYLIAYIINANLGLVKHWLDERCPMPPEALARMVLSIMKNGPLSIRQGAEEAIK